MLVIRVITPTKKLTTARIPAARPMIQVAGSFFFSPMINAAKPKPNAKGVLQRRQIEDRIMIAGCICTRTARSAIKKNRQLRAVRTIEMTAVK